MTVSIAVDNDGTLRGLRVDLVFDQGAYPAFPITVAMFGGMMRVMFPGSYRWDAFEIRARAVATNKGRYVAYRGPWANETWARERMLDIVARALGMRPTDLRLKNMMGEDDMAPAMITGPTLDATMSTKKTLERAIELIDIDAFRVEQERARAAGRYLGLGIASYHEAAPGPPNYFSSVSPGFRHADGRGGVDGDHAGRFGRGLHVADAARAEPRDDVRSDRRRRARRVAPRREDRLRRHQPHAVRLHRHRRQPRRTDGRRRGEVLLA